MLVFRVYVFSFYVSLLSDCIRQFCFEFLEEGFRILALTGFYNLSRQLLLLFFVTKS
jgi:hypothetical protein